MRQITILDRAIAHNIVNIERLNSLAPEAIMALQKRSFSLKQLQRKPPGLLVSGAVIGSALPINTMC